MILPTTIDMLDMQHADRFTDRCPGNFGFVRAKRNFVPKGPPCQSYWVDERPSWITLHSFLADLQENIYVLSDLDVCVTS
jgi:hypothetical protein